jgi:hypothetical protein
VVGLFVLGLAGALAALYTADRLIKARAQVRRLRRMSDRLAAATARSDKQQAQRQAAERAGAELTSFMPAIGRPPLTLPGIRPGHPVRSQAGGEDTGPH